MTTPESKVKTKLKRILDARKPDLWYHMPVMTRWGRKTVDILGYYMGEGFAIEAKALGEVPTPYQQNTLDELGDASVQTFIIDGDYTELLDWLNDVKSRHPCY